MPELKKKMQHDPGSRGLPSWYPKPPQDKDLLFYIQRNQNQDAIVYQLNRRHDGLINEQLPMDAYWMRFSKGGGRTELNQIQSKLAYGYESEIISPELFKFRFVAYKELDFYIVRTVGEHYEVHHRVGKQMVRLTNIYVYALEFGVFPDVKYIELYGEQLDDQMPTYKKITIE